MVRAKFVVQHILRSRQPVWIPDEQRNELKEVQTVTLYPVSRANSPDDSAENADFWAATPSGKIELAIVNPAAVAGFPLGSAVYVDFTPAPA